jgi:hypothetical protein
VVKADVVMRPAGGRLVWVKDSTRSLVVDADGGQSWTLEGNAALCWEWMLAGSSLGQICHMLAFVASVTVGDASRILAGIIDDWLACGMCKLDGKGDLGQSIG